jgi:pyrimidine-nucleoside phosphorylase
MKYNAVDLIRKKRNGGKFNRNETEYLVSAYTAGDIPDYQFSALLMAMFLRGMDTVETSQLTRAMLNSGKKLDLSGIRRPKVDKHSTGGVGDKVSLVLAPLVACCGVCVPMISGRSLGHTGGTLDKLESIPGFRTGLSAREFKDQLKKIGVAVMGQTREIAPADRKMYALRDVTATVDSIPLIAASIMSKKLAEDIDGLVLDVKFGSGAFMQGPEKAESLARTMLRIGKLSGVRVTAVLTDANNPLGECVGNALEVVETIESLKGRGPDDLMEVTFTLGEEMLRIAGIRGGRRLLAGKISSGEALEKFRQLVMRQGGDKRVMDDYSRLPAARKKYRVTTAKTGFVRHIDTFRLGMLATALGAGRLKKDDLIDAGCGFRIYKKIGDPVRKGDTLVEVLSDRRGAAVVSHEIRDAYQIDRERCPRKKLVRCILR